MTTAKQRQVLTTVEDVTGQIHAYLALAAKDPGPEPASQLDRRNDMVDAAIAARAHARKLLDELTDLVQAHRGSIR